MSMRPGARGVTGSLALVLLAGCGGSPVAGGSEETTAIQATVIETGEAVKRPVYLDCAM